MGSSKIQKKLKEIFKNLDMSSISIDQLESVVIASGDEEARKAFNKKKEKIQTILNHRNISKNLDYAKINSSALKSDASSWRKLSKEISIKGNTGKIIKAELSSTPIADLGIFTHLQKGEGITSSERDHSHVANLWKTEAKSSSDGKVLFSALRHRNTRGNDNASKEMVLAAAVEQYGLEAIQKSPENKVWEVKLGNVQLMSPVKGKHNPLSSDKNMPFKQMKAFEQLEEKPFTIDIKDSSGNQKKIKLLLKKTILTNFGANDQHYILDGNLVKSSHKQNRKALEKLFGEKILKSVEEAFKSYDKKNKELCEFILKKNFEENVSEGKLNPNKTGEVGSYLGKLYAKKKEENANINQINLKVKKIINLSKQILDLWCSTNGVGLASNPYAIQTRLSALLYLIGYPVSFNCKSGKDRTGELAAEINDLVTTIEVNDGEVPDPYKELSDDEKLQASNMLDATQSEIISESNTGFKGLKVGFKGTINRSGKIKGSTKHARPSGSI